MYILTRPIYRRPIQNLLSSFITRKIPRANAPPMSQQSAISLKIIPAPTPMRKTYIDKNEYLKRTLSPHLSVYRPQLTSMLSISLRMTGFTLGIMAWVVGLTALLSDKKVDYFVEELQRLNINDNLWVLAKTIVVFPFSYHYVTGVRHLFFDTAKLMEIKQFYATGYTALVLSSILAVVLGLLENIRSADGDEETSNE